MRRLGDSTRPSTRDGQPPRHRRSGHGDRSVLWHQRSWSGGRSRHRGPCGHPIAFHRRSPTRTREMSRTLWPPPAFPGCRGGAARASHPRPAGTSVRPRSRRSLRELPRRSPWLSCRGVFGSLPPAVSSPRLSQRTAPERGSGAAPHRYWPFGRRSHRPGWLSHRQRCGPHPAPLALRAPRSRANTQEPLILLSLSKC